jgi:hypothetical protein
VTSPDVRPAVVVLSLILLASVGGIVTQDRPITRAVHLAFMLACIFAIYKLFN